MPRPNVEYSSKGHKFSYSLELRMIFSKIMSAFTVFGKIVTGGHSITMWTRRGR